MGKTKNGIYYQDNYASKADILKDQKEMAESIDLIIDNIDSEQEEQDKKIKSIEQKNTEQDTNIGNIQKENIELKEECKRLKNDLKSSVLTGQVKAENIVLNDSSNARLMKLEIGGNHKQETREGYNLLDTSNVEEKEYDGVKVTRNSDGSINFKGAATKDFAFTYSIEKVLNGQYQESIEVVGTINEGTGFMSSTIWNGGTNLFGDLILKSNSTQTLNKTFAGDTNMTHAMFYVATGAVLDCTIYPLLYRFDGTSKKYEQYGAMPSFEFPSEVRAVGDNANIVISNKNPLKITETSVTSNGVTTTHSNNKIVSKGTVSLNWFNIISWEKCFIPANTYTISYDKTIQGRLVAKFKYADGETKSIYINPSYKKASFTLEKDTVEFILNIDQLTANDNVNFETNIQIEQGTVATDIVPHEEQNYIMPVQEKMLEDDYIDDIELHGWNTYVLTGKEKWWNTFGTNLFNVSNLLTNIKQEEHVLLSNKYKYNSVHSNINNNTKNGEFAIQFSTSTEKGNVFIKDTRFDNIDDFKKYLQDQFDGGNPVYICYKLAEPKKLELTEEQKKVLEQIEKEAHTYKNITHIYSTDEVSTILDAEYVKDLDTVLNNLANASLVGGN